MLLLIHSHMVHSRKDLHVVSMLLSLLLMKKLSFPPYLCHLPLIPDSLWVRIRAAFTRFLEMQWCARLLPAAVPAVVCELPLAAHFVVRALLPSSELSSLLLSLWSLYIHSPVPTPEERHNSTVQLEFRITGEFCRNSWSDCYASSVWTQKTGSWSGGKKTSKQGGFSLNYHTS